MKQKVVRFNCDTPVKNYLAQGYYLPIDMKLKVEMLESLKSNGLASSEELIALENELFELSTKYERVRQNIKTFADKGIASDQRYGQVLELRYIRGLSIDEVAKSLMYTRRWTQKLLKKALTKFEKYLIENNVGYQ